LKWYWYTWPSSSSAKRLFCDAHSWMNLVIR
jgi:hypothetical protein